MRPQGGAEPGHQRAVAALVLGGLALHLGCAGRYGPHRDELYLRACGRALAWGSPDHAPLGSALARLAELAGAGQLGLRVLAALAGALTVWWTARLTRRLGGDGAAGLCAAGAALLAPVLMHHAGVYGTGTLEVLAAVAGFDALVFALAAPGRARRWLLVGLAFGLGLLAKYTLGLWLVGLALGLLASDRRRVLATPGPWLALATALALLAPNLVWQARHGAPALDFIASSHDAVRARFSRLAVLAAQPVLMHPVGFGLALPGLARGWREAGVARVFAVAFVVAAAALVLAPGKPYYLAPGYLPLWALGAPALARWLAARGRGLRVLLVAGTALAGAVAFVITLPVLPRSLLRRLEVARISSELPQFADWRAVVADIAHAHAVAGRVAEVVLTDSYGTAAALELHGTGLPRVRSGANGYFLRGPGRQPAALLVLGYPRALLGELCRELRVVGAVRAQGGAGNRYDFPRTIWLCRPRAQLAALWPRLRRYD
ncbi:MAG: glycosyltransferase family 39 protein [Deltaproteobacteria bacterium]|nr:glycosyltransferase family 39 protein [Deltaproteobacteria bacterium]